MFPYEEGKFVKTFISGNEWVKKTAVRGGLKPLVYQTFCIYLEISA